MRLEGQIFKNKGIYLIEVPALGLLSQAKTLSEAKRMAKFALEDFAGKTDFEAKVTFFSDRRFVIEGSDSRVVIGLMLRNLRQEKGLTIREVVDRLGAKSPRAYSAYENGERSPSSDKLAELIQAIDPDCTPVTHLVKVS